MTNQIFDVFIISIVFYVVYFSECKSEISKNVCEKGLIETTTSCIECGECYYYWDKITKRYKNITIPLIDGINTIKGLGNTDTYAKEFSIMRQQLDKIDTLLEQNKFIDLESIQSQLTNIDSLISKISRVDDLIILEEEIDNSIDELIKSLNNLTIETEKLQLTNIDETLNMIKSEEVRAENLKLKAVSSQEKLNEASYCKEIDDFNETEEEFNNVLNNSEDLSEKITKEFIQFNEIINRLNKMLCDNIESNECSLYCGGAGCGYCGNSTTCRNATGQLLQNSFALINDTEKLLNEKKVQITKIYDLNTTARNILSKDISGKPEEVLDTFVTLNDHMDKLKLAIQILLNNKQISLEDIQNLSKSILSKVIHLDDKEIEELKNKIESLVNIDTNNPILLQDYKNMARILLDEATNAKLTTNKLTRVILEIYKDVQNKCNISEDANGISETIDVCFSDKTLLVKTTANDIEQTSIQLNQIKQSSMILQNKLNKNSNYSQMIIDRFGDIRNDALNLRYKSDELLNQLEEVKTVLDVKIKKVDSSSSRANNLVDRMLNLIDLDIDINDVDDWEDNLTNLLLVMDEYNEKISKICN